MPKSRLCLKDSNLKWQTSNSLQYDIALPRRSKTTFYSLQPHYAALSVCVSYGQYTDGQILRAGHCRTGQDMDRTMTDKKLGPSLSCLSISSLSNFSPSLHCALSLATQCTVIGPVCLFVCVFVCGFVCLWICLPR